MDLLFFGAAITFTMWAQNKVKRSYATYSKVASIARMPGHIAAAFSHVVAMATSFLTLLYFVFRLLALGNRRD